MPLLSDDLTVWEIGFRWAGLDPAGRWLRIPLAVRDNFRNLMDAVLQGHLYCSTLSLERWEPMKDGVPEGYIRQWLDDVYACIEGRAFNRKLLRWAVIDRWAMQLWCERMGIPLPEFWFPFGWNLDYRWPAEEVQEASPVAPPADDIDCGKEGEPGPAQDGMAAAPAPTATPAASPGEREVAGKRVLDRRQRAKIACQEVGRRYWEIHPDALLKTVAASREVQEIAPGSVYELEVVQGWMSEIDPRDPSKKRGPKKRKSEARGQRER